MKHVLKLCQPTSAGSRTLSLPDISFPCYLPSRTFSLSCVFHWHRRLENTFTRTLTRCAIANVPKSRSGSVVTNCRNYGSRRKHNGDNNGEHQMNNPEGLFQRIVYSDENLVALNKPRGLSVYGSFDKKVEASQDQAVKQSSNLTIVQSLSCLREKMDSPELDIGLSLKSFYSGLVLLSRNKESKAKLDKCLAQITTQKGQFMTYLAVTVGIPQCQHRVTLFADIKREFLHDREMSVVSDKTSHSARKAGHMIQICFTVNPLVINKDIGTALVEVVLNKDKWEAVQVLMSHYLSPVLGDNVYSSRTITVSDVPFPTSAHAAVPGPQRLPASIAKALRSQSVYRKDVPLLVHRCKVSLSKFPSKFSPPLSLTAKPDQDFLEVLRCLGLYRAELFTQQPAIEYIEMFK